MCLPTINYRWMPPCWPSDLEIPFFMYSCSQTGDLKESTPQLNRLSDMEYLLPRCAAIRYSKSSKPVKNTENSIYSQVICSIPASHPSYQGIQINDHWNIQSKQTASLWPIHLYPLNFKIISKIWLGNWQFFHRFPFSILHILFFSLVWQVKRTLHSNLQWWSKPTD